MRPEVQVLPGPQSGLWPAETLPAALELGRL